MLSIKELSEKEINVEVFETYSKHWKYTIITPKKLEYSYRNTEEECVRSAIIRANEIYNNDKTLNK